MKRPCGLDVKQCRLLRRLDTGLGCRSPRQPLGAPRDRSWRRQAQGCALPWLADANDGSGIMTWIDANNWAANLSIIDSVNSIKHGAHHASENLRSLPA